MSQLKQIKLTKNDIEFLVNKMATINSQSTDNERISILSKIHSDEKVKLVTIASMVINGDSSLIPLNLDDNTIMIIKMFLTNYQRILAKNPIDATITPGNVHDNDSNQNHVTNSNDDNLNNMATNESNQVRTNEQQIKTLSTSDTINKPVAKRNSEKPIPRGWYKIDNYIIEPVLIIKKENTTGMEIAQEIDKILMSKNNFLGKIIQFVPREDHVIVSFNNVPEMNYCITAINENIPEWKPILPDDVKPKIKILGVFIDGAKNYDWEMFIKRLKTRNGWSEGAAVSFCFAYSPRRNKFHDIVIQVTPRIRYEIEINRGIISVDNLKKFVVDHFDIKRCTICFEYNSHSRDKCNNTQKCPYCSAKHERCPMKNDRSLYLCPACNGQAHSAYSKNCPKFRAALSRALKKIEFEYKWIMAKPTSDDY